MSKDTSVINFPMQILPKEAAISDFQLICQVRLKLTNKLNRVSKGEYELTEEDKEDIRIVNDVFLRNGYRTIDVDITQL